jgi:tetratricopeptide (TPR) repeat protein
MFDLARQWFRSPGRALRLSGMAAALCALSAAAAQPAPPAFAASAPAVANSSLDAPLFYQLLIGEIELRGGDAGTAFQVMLDAARRTRDETVFRRAVEVALQAHAGEQALDAVHAWRDTVPTSTDALRFEVQLLLALNKGAEVGAPLKALLAKVADAERPALIGALPQLFQRTENRLQSAQTLEAVLEPYEARPDTRTASRVALGRIWLAAGEPARALSLAEQANEDDPQAPGPIALALELMATTPAAERIVTDFIARPGTEVNVRLAYARVLTALQRYGDAVKQFDQVAREQPTLAPPLLSLGALRLELREPVEAERVLQRYVQLAQEEGAPPAGSETQNDTDPLAAAEQPDLSQAWLLLAQAAEQRGDYPAAEGYLARIDDPQRLLDVQSRRAGLMARQGHVDEARALLRRLPERNDGEARAKLLAEAQVLRDVKRWGDAYTVLDGANQRFTGDVDLMYEQSMAAEKIDRLDEMERLLRKVIELKPDHQHAYNALGYSLADRNQRLPEARALIEKALELSPGDPFITDSLGWVEFRLGNHPQSLRLLRQAYAVRPDIEIAAHLGEVLWTTGDRDEARRVWRDAQGRDAANELLRNTLARLKVEL